MENEPWPAADAPADPRTSGRSRHRSCGDRQADAELTRTCAEISSKITVSGHVCESRAAPRVEEVWARGSGRGCSTRRWT